MLLWCVRGPRIYSTAYTLQDTGTVFDKARTRLEAGWVVRECRCRRRGILRVRRALPLVASWTTDDGASAAAKPTLGFILILTLWHYFTVEGDAATVVYG